MIPIGVFLVLMVALRDPLACVNLVATMLLTYLFALGATHLLFITCLGAEGLDWKVPYFLFVLLVAVGVDYNVFLMARLHEEIGTLGLRAGIGRAVAQTGGLISSAAAITAVSFASFLFSPLGSLRQLGFALVVGIAVDALLVRPLLVPCGQWLLNRKNESRRMGQVPTRAGRERAPSLEVEADGRQVAGSGVDGKLAESGSDDRQTQILADQRSTRYPLLPARHWLPALDAWGAGVADGLGDDASGPDAGRPGPWRWHPGLGRLDRGRGRVDRSSPSRWR